VYHPLWSDNHCRFSILRIYMHSSRLSTLSWWYSSLRGLLYIQEWIIGSTCTFRLNTSQVLGFPGKYCNLACKSRLFFIYNQRLLVWPWILGSDDFCWRSPKKRNVLGTLPCYHQLAMSNSVSSTLVDRLVGEDLN